MNLGIFQYHILRVKAIAIGGGVFIFRRNIKTGLYDILDNVVIAIAIS